MRFSDFQRRAAAFLAISRRRCGDSFSALASPPFNPPGRPRAGALSSASPVAMSTIALASWFMSAGRFCPFGPFGIRLIWHGWPADASPGAERKIFKLTHYPEL